MLTHTRLGLIAHTATKETKESGVARSSCERHELAIAFHALVARAFVVVVAVGVVVQVGALALPAFERARVAKRQPTVFVFRARHTAGCGWRGASSRNEQHKED